MPTIIKSWHFQENLGPNFILKDNEFKENTAMIEKRTVGDRRRPLGHLGQSAQHLS